jgi:hypothetical protein
MNGSLRLRAMIARRVRERAGNRRAGRANGAHGHCEAHSARRHLRRNRTRPNAVPSDDVVKLHSRRERHCAGSSRSCDTPPMQVAAVAVMLLLSLM